MTRKRDRFFAGFGALLFLVTGSALAIAVVINGISNHNKHKTDSSSSKPTQSQTTKADCQATTTTNAAEDLPATYKPTGNTTQLEATDLQSGSGPSAKSGSCLIVKYYGTLAKDGTVFDENFDKPTGFKFQLGAGQVIKGWDEGLLGAKQGSTRRLVIPADLAYGSQPQGSIPANSVLVFVVKVLSVQ